MPSVSKCAFSATMAILVALATLAPHPAPGQVAQQGPQQTPQTETELDEPSLAQRAALTYVIVDAATVPDPLTDQPGDPARGLALFEGEAGCADCHSRNARPSGIELLKGPSMAGVGTRLSVGEVRLWVVNPSALTPDSAMPAYYTLVGPDGARLERSRLTAQEVEDVVAYLDTLTAATRSALPPAE